MSTDASKRNIVPLLAAGAAAYFVYRWTFGFLTAQLDAPEHLATVQALSYTPLGLLLHPVTYLVSTAVAAACAVLVFTTVRRRRLPNSSLTQVPEDAPHYRWSCTVCGTANEAGKASCRNCGCRADASGKEILRFKESIRDRNDV